jgi:hypothetical protein
VTDYPVSAPFHAAPQAEAQVARLRRWTYALLGAAGVLLLTMAAAGVFWFDAAGRRDEDAPAREEAPARDDAAREAAAAAQRRVDKLLDALGGMGGSHLYQSFINLELLADSVDGAVYTKDEARQKLTVMLGMMKQVDQHLQKLKDVGLPPDEQAAVDATRKLSAALRREAEALRAFWKTGGVEEEAQYQAAHDEALAALSALMPPESVKNK